MRRYLRERIIHRDRAVIAVHRSVKPGIRIVAGSFRGRRIEVPDRGTRPFADRVRQSLFAILEPRLSGARVLDLCAGSGASGFEALSRGAAFVQFVERSRAAVMVIERNAAALECVAACSVRVGDAATIARGDNQPLDTVPFDIVIFDPPYDDLGLRMSVLSSLAVRGSMLAPRGLLVASWRRVRGGGAEAAPIGLRLVRTLEFGETEIVLLERVESDTASDREEKEGA